jgi:S-adenosylmethionine-diacylglycerol 3-amino-3-carboxypropyl transferase
VGKKIMKKNPLQFSVVREDPQIEMDLVEKFGLERATLIGSGGCTAFCLKSLNPDLKITLIEPNPAQIALIKEKITALEKGEIEKFGSFIERGNFESLFRQFRGFIYEFIHEKSEIERAFAENSRQFWQEIFANPYWSVAFELFFSDAILTAMFTSRATQNAPKNSYPAYFRRALEKGLMREDAPRNYFLHHIFLGFYLNSALPFYLTKLPTNFEFDFFDDFAQNFQAFKGKQLVHFSNIFDWCDSASVEQIARNAAENLETGSVVTIRQLNNAQNYRPFFGENFRWLETDKIIEKDRSLFYSKIEIGEKI